eukprot:jgi/Mesen1/8152/ME000438S07258
MAATLASQAIFGPGCLRTTGRTQCSGKQPASSVFMGEKLKCRTSAFGAALSKKHLKTRAAVGDTRVQAVALDNAILSEPLAEAGVSKEEVTEAYKAQKADPKTVVSIILGGGAGTRLFPLTKTRAKPAVPIGGAYRLIDVPMSNCINSGIKKIYILTQFNSASLNRHLSRTYNFGNGVNFGDGFVEALSATQTPVAGTGNQWFEGTADAVRKFAWLLKDVRNKDVEDIVILSGDHLYRMDYMDFVQKHRDTNADITVSVLPMDEERASDFGLVKIDSQGRVTSFIEKPKGADLKRAQVDTSVLGLAKEEAKKFPYIASMGVYVFKKDFLLHLLEYKYENSNDFGGEIIPFCVRDGNNVQAYLFDGYWEDIGTIRSFYEANLALAEQVVRSIISHGCFLSDCSVEGSVVGIRSRLDSGVQLTDTYMVGADYYETEADRASIVAQGKVPMGIGANSQIRNAIIDKNARVGKNVVIANKDDVQEASRSDQGFYIRSGVVVVTKNGVIPDNMVI